MKWYMLTIFLPLIACVEQPQQLQHGVIIDSNGQYHYADDYTYRAAQTNLDEFCYTPLVDINRILRNEDQRKAKETVCRKDSVNLQKAAKKIAEGKETAQQAQQEEVEHASESGGDYTNPKSPNTEGGSNIYIDVNHGHPQ